MINNQRDPHHREISSKYESRKTKDNRISYLVERKAIGARLLQTISKRRLVDYGSMFAHASTLSYFAVKYVQERKVMINHAVLKNGKFNIDFSFNYNRIADLECLLYFRFRKTDILDWFQCWRGRCGRIIKSEIDTVYLLSFQHVSASSSCYTCNMGWPDKTLWK